MKKFITSYCSSIYWWFWYMFRKADDPTYTSLLNRTICRWKRHPAGIWFYNPNGFSPDNSCKNCGDILY